MKFYENGGALAKDMGIDLQVLVDEHNQHAQAVARSSTTTSCRATKLQPSLSMLPSSLLQSITAWEDCRSALMEKLKEKVESSLASTQQVRLQAASMVTTVLVAAPCWIAWSSAVCAPRLH